MCTKVAIAECQSYQQDEVDARLAQCLKLLGGLSAFVKPNSRVLIKPNVLMEKDPEAAVTTHPSVVAALVKAVKKLGAIPLVGDSPASYSANVHQTMETVGIRKATEENGGKMVYFQETGVAAVPSPSHHSSIKTLRIAKSVLEADAIINLPKLKTHNFTLFTGAIKNLFGCITGFAKSKHHALAPNPYEFSKSLVDLLEVIKPSLNIMDAVYGMEGHGPAGGEKRLMGALLASSDAVALDAVSSAAIGFDPFEIASTKIAHERGLGEARLDKIEILGTPFAKIKKEDWKHVRVANIHSLAQFVPKWLSFLARPLALSARINPVIIQEKCTQCRICLENCPSHTIHEKNGKIVIDHSQCIMCFCCHELCPYQAIQLKKSWFLRLLRIIRDE